jgi:HAD superfamily hydrolase (TIGR01490 family)
MKLQAPSAPPAGAAAFFDLDKTVVARSSTLAFSRELYREGLIGPAIMIKSAYAQMAYSRMGANAQRMDKSRVALMALTKGWEAARVQRLVRETLQEVIDPMIYAEALDLFDEHRRAGRDLYLVSSSGIEVVVPLAEYLGVPGVIATRAGIDEDGRYDGSMEFYCYGAQKATAMEEVAVQRRLDLALSYAYSDSITDLPMLEAVGHPVAVNPDRELRAHAVAANWEIRDFVQPVALRSRLSQVPRPPTEVVAGAGALGALALAWLVYGRRQLAGLDESEERELGRQLQRSARSWLERRPRASWRAPGWRAPGWRAPGWRAPGWRAPGWRAPGAWDSLTGSRR